MITVILLIPGHGKPEVPKGAATSTLTIAHLRAVTLSMAEEANIEADRSRAEPVVWHRPGVDPLVDRARLHGEEARYVLDREYRSAQALVCREGSKARRALWPFR
jgi:hypothetical protein